jgi:hypothetical protein
LTTQSRRHEKQTITSVRIGKAKLIRRGLADRQRLDNEPLCRQRSILIDQSIGIGQLLMRVRTAYHAYRGAPDER